MGLKFFLKNLKKKLKKINMNDTLCKTLAGLSKNLVSKNDIYDDVLIFALFMVNLLRK